MTKKKWGFVIAAIIVAIISFIIPVPEPLTRQSALVLGALVWSMILFGGGILPMFGVAMAMTFSWIVLGKVAPATVWGGFSGNTWWLMASACIIGIAVSKSGIGARIALWICKKLPANYFGLSLTIYLSGLVINPFVPSTTTKVVMVASLARSISKALGYKDQSKQVAGLFIAYFCAFCTYAPSFLSASFISYTIVGMFDEGAAIGTMQWFLYALPWTIIVWILMFFIQLKMYKPADDTPLSKDYVNAEYEKLGPISRDEKITGLVILVCFIAWCTEQFHGLAAAHVAMLGALVVAATGIVVQKDMKDMPWGTLIFCGSLLNVGPVFKAVFINDWLTANLAPVMTPFMENPWIFIPMLCIVTYIAKFLVTPMAALVPLMLTILMPMCYSVGMNPWIAGFVVYACSCLWNAEYQTNPLLTAKAAFGGGEVTGPHMLIAPKSFAFMVVNMLGCMACIPFWQMFGLL